jgi:hypothetical protein
MPKPLTGIACEWHGICQYSSNLNYHGNLAYRAPSIQISAAFEGIRAKRSAVLSLGGRDGLGAPNSTSTTRDSDGIFCRPPHGRQVKFDLH